MADPNTIILHATEGATVSSRSRVLKSGKVKARTTIEVDAEPLVHFFDDELSAKPGADALVEAIKRDMTKNVPNAKPSTIRFRRRAADAFAKGADWAEERYSGGRTGPLPPNQTPRKWSDSGRIFSTLVARWTASTKEFIINVAANRLKDPALAKEFVNDIPTLRNARSFMRSDEFLDAVDVTLQTMVQKARNQREAELLARLGAKRAQLKALRMRLGKTALKLVGL